MLPMGCFKKVHVTGATHVVSCLIASHAELLKLFNLFPFRPRSRAVRRRRKPAQVQHSLHQVCIVDRGVLGALLSAFVQQKVIREFTLTVARVALAEQKTALAGVVLESSFVRFKASMAAFNAEIVVLFRPLGRRGSAWSPW